jgi:UDP-2,3-diacylglucosamine pyrophosphatase LpxH
MKQTKFTILHLSDIHLHDPEGLVKGTDPAIAKAFCNHDFTNDKIDLIAVTGDVFDGPYFNTDRAIPKGDNYYGEFFFKKLKDINPDPSKTLFAYGNHDMKVRISKELNKDSVQKKDDEGNLQKLSKFLVNRSDNEENLNSFKEQFEIFLEKYTKGKNDLITTKFEMAHAFAKFIETCIAKENGPISLNDLEKQLFFNFDTFIDASQDTNKLDGKPFSYGIHFFEENNVIVARINTSWQNISSPYLDGWLSCGSIQIDQIEKKIQEIKNLKSPVEPYVITLMHNAFNSLGYQDVHIPADNKRSIALQISGFSDLILCGHEHGELPPSLMHFESYMLKTGGLMNNKSPKNSFSIIRLDFEKRELQRELFMYDKETTTFEITKVLHDNEGLYKKFELKPKKASSYFVNQARDIEEYLQFFKDFNLEFTQDDTLSPEMAEIFTHLMKSSAYCNLFFNRKEEIQHRAYINELL